MTGDAQEATQRNVKPSPVDETQEPSDAPSSMNMPTKRNAFSELMSPKSTKTSKISSGSNIESGSQGHSGTSTKSSDHPARSTHAPHNPRFGLLQYIENPSSVPKGTILRVTDDTVLIRDLYPKATIHLLLLPRSAAHHELHPHQAFADANFLSLVKREAASAVDLAAGELSRLLSPSSASCRARNEAMDMPDPPATLPSGRDFRKELRVGIHAHPSMHHLHIHIISRDMHSPAMKHRKHYNSFNTDFFIPLDDYPLSTGDQRRSVSYQNANLSRDFVCWRCGMAFGNKFKKLKDHLEEEYLQWRAE